MRGLADLWVVCGWLGWFESGLWVIWLVCVWFGLFVCGLAGLWVVSGFTANEDLRSNGQLIF